MQNLVAAILEGNLPPVKFQITEQVTHKEKPFVCMIWGILTLWSEQGFNWVFTKASVGGLMVHVPNRAWRTFSAGTQAQVRAVKIPEAHHTPDHQPMSKEAGAEVAMGGTTVNHRNNRRVNSTLCHFMLDVKFNHNHITRRNNDLRPHPVYSSRSNMVQSRNITVPCEHGVLVTNLLFPHESPQISCHRPPESP